MCPNGNVHQGCSSDSCSKSSASAEDGLAVQWRAGLQDATVICRQAWAAARSPSRKDALPGRPFEVEFSQQNHSAIVGRATACQRSLAGCRARLAHCKSCLASMLLNLPTYQNKSPDAADVHTSTSSSTESEANLWLALGHDAESGQSDDCRGHLCCQGSAFRTCKEPCFWKAGLEDRSVLYRATRWLPSCRVLASAPLPCH